MKDDIIDSTIKELMEVAIADGIVSSDELEIIKQVKIDLDSYDLHLRDAKMDGFIDEDEMKILESLRDLIIERADIIASVDGKLSEDEKALLTTLKNFVKKYYV
jgi:tellurite resistance protein